MKNQLLLLEDVDGLGRSGDIVNAKPGFARNFLLPSKKAIIAQKHTIRLQEKLKEERAKKALVDKKEAEAIANEIHGKVIEMPVKIDQAGHLYGSVTVQDILQLIKEQLSVELEKRNVQLSKPIKALGSFEVFLKLKEGVPAHVVLHVKAEEKTVEEEK